MRAVKTHFDIDVISPRQMIVNGRKVVLLRLGSTRQAKLIVYSGYGIAILQSNDVIAISDERLFKLTTRYHKNTLWRWRLGWLLHELKVIDAATLKLLSDEHEAASAKEKIDNLASEADILGYRIVKLRKPRAVKLRKSHTVKKVK